MTAKQQLEQEIEDYESLVHHPGWERLVARIKGNADTQMSKMRNAPSQEELLKATYTYLALHDLPQVPEVILTALRAQLTRLPK